MNEKRPLLTDPEVLEALAHPVRLDLLSYLMSDGPATASACARAVGTALELQLPPARAGPSRAGGAGRLARRARAALAGHHHRFPDRAVGAAAEAEARAHRGGDGRLGRS